MVHALSAEGALLLAAIGLLLICAEFCLPGWVWPGALGGVCLACGVYRLADRGANPLAAAGLVALLFAAGWMSYGDVSPAWVSWLLLGLVPLPARELLPTGIGWPTALCVAIPGAAISMLLRVAGRAAWNKTFME